MGTRPTLSALRRKYALTLGLGDAEAAAHLRAVILMFAPDDDVDAIQPIQTRGPYRRWRKLIIPVLKAANHPLGATEIARRLMPSLDVAGDRRALHVVASNIHHTLVRLAARGIVKVEGKPRRFSLRG